MKRTGPARKVERALRDADRKVRAALKDLNYQAGQLVTHGSYGQAEPLVNQARIIAAFQTEIASLRDKWLGLWDGASSASARKAERSALWEFYQPILHALVDLEGTAKRADLEKKLDSTAPTKLKPGDLECNSRGIPHWKVMLKRARRPMIKEGFLDRLPGSDYQITAAGRRAIEAGAAPTPQRL